MQIFLRFNRYMVECEYMPEWYKHYGLTVLIDTWWNVNKSLIKCSKNE